MATILAQYIIDQEGPLPAPSVQFTIYCAAMNYQLKFWVVMSVLTKYQEIF